MSGRKRLRFTDVDDLLLLREVLSNNPFENPLMWSIIQEHIVLITGKSFSIRTLKDHIELLIKLWLEHVKILKDKSGIEIEYTEKNNLCENVYSMMEEFKKETKNKIKKNTLPIEKKLGIEARDRCTYVIHEPSHEDEPSTRDDIISINHDHSTPVKSRKRKINTQRQGLAYLATYDDHQRKIKEKELQLEERRLMLEERKVALQEKQHEMNQPESERRMRLEEKKMDILNNTFLELGKVIERQENIINLVLSKK